MGSKYTSRWNEKWQCRAQFDLKIKIFSVSKLMMSDILDKKHYRKLNLRPLNINDTIEYI